MRSTVLILFLLAAISPLTAEPDRSLKTVDAGLDAIAVHAKNYPPTFASAEQRQQIEADLHKLIVQLDAAVAARPDDPELLLRDGFANSMGHNLDFAGSAPQCVKVFDHLLALQPDNATANLHYGIFLAGAGHQQQGIRHLQKAVDLGINWAHRPLALAYLTLQDKEGAARHLRTYLSHYPNDKGAQKLLTAIKSKDVKFTTTRTETPAKAPPSPSPEPKP